MRILTAEEFNKEPYGIVYIRFVPLMFIGEPKIKSEPRGGTSWWATDILPWVTDDEEFNEWEKYKGYELETEGFCTDDATYNYDSKDLYVVFNKDEVKGMINRLIESLYKSEQYNRK